MKAIKNTLLILICIVCTVNANAQCSIIGNDVVANFSFTSPPSRFGQTFTACDNGVIQSISLEVIQALDSIRFYIGSPTGALLPGPYEIFPVPAVQGEGTLATFSFEIPFPVSLGTTYEFQIGSLQQYTVGSAADNIMGYQTLDGVDYGLDLTIQIQIAPYCAAGEAFNTACVACAAGTASPDGAACVQCNEGFFQDSAGMANCKPCEEGLFQALKGATMCDSCNVGTFSNSKGRISCIECELGRYQDEKGQKECKICPPGTYGDATRLTTCTPCASGLTSPAGSTSASACVAANSIPTLSEWALIILGVSLSIFGVVKIRNRVIQMS